MNHPRGCARSAMLRLPPQGGAASGQGNPGHGGRWDGLLRGLWTLFGACRAVYMAHPVSRASRLHAVLAGALLLPALGWAQNVSLHGVLGSKALLVIDGGAPRTMAPGESRQGVELVSAGGDQAVVRVGGERVTLRVGASPVRVGTAAPSGSDRVALTADARGHFFTQGSINNRPVQFLVDTGASVVSIGQAEADRLRLDYRAGQVVRLNTANGLTPGWVLKLSQLRVGDITAYNVDAVVVPAPMPAVLLGNSFLSRFSMQREGSQLLLIRR